MKTAVPLTLARAAALVAIATAVPAAADNAPKQVPCYGVNGCRGQSDCMTAHNACKGQNSCKGQGFKALAAAACTAAGGSLKPAS